MNSGRGAGPAGGRGSIPVARGNADQRRGEHYSASAFSTHPSWKRMEGRSASYGGEGARAGHMGFVRESRM